MFAMADVTPTQGRYLAYIHAYTEGFGLSPSESEIADAIGVALPSANQMIRTLEKKGLIRRQPGVPRSIEVLVSPDVLPKWKGERITRTVRGEPRSSEQAHDGQAAVYRFRIILQGSDPVIWRRIETTDVELEQLHRLIQTAMGWTDSHLHQFKIAGSYYVDPEVLDELDDDGVIDYSGLRVSDLVAKHGVKLRFDYEYDFGDSWEHEIILEAVTKPEQGVRYPRCLDGERACPPEDIGGIYGFAEFVEAISNRRHKEHDEFLEYYGPFNPGKFSAAKTTRNMREGLSMG
jgi:hypothetical protein